MATRTIKESNACTLRQKLPKLDLSGESLQHSLLQLCYVLQHFEELLSLDLLLHCQQHLVDHPHDIEHRVALLVDLVHSLHCFMDPSSLSESQDRLDFFNGWRITDVQYHFVSNDLALACEMAGLDVVDSLSHVSIGNEEQCLKGLLGDLHILSFDHPLEVELDFVLLELAEAEDDASTLNGLDDLGRGVAAEHKASCLTEVADDHPQGVLRSLSQAVCLIQHDDFGSACGERDLLLSKRFDLLADHIYSSLIRGIEFKGRIFELSLEQFAHNAEYTRCLPYSWRPSQNEVRDVALSNTGAQGVDLLDIAEDFAESFRAILFQPNLFHMALYYKCKYSKINAIKACLRLYDQFLQNHREVSKEMQSARDTRYQKAMPDITRQCLILLGNAGEVDLTWCYFYKV